MASHCQFSLSPRFSPPLQSIACFVGAIPAGIFYGLHSMLFWQACLRGVFAWA